MNIIVDTWNRYGLRAAARLAAYKTAQQFITLDITQLMILDLSQIEESNAISCTFRFLTYDDVVSLAADRELDLDASLAGRLLGELDTCFGAFSGERLVGYVWIASGSIEATHNSAGSEATGVAMSFGPEARFLYKAFVHPEFRGAGLYTEMILAAGRLVNERDNVHFFLSTTDWTNYAALRACRRQGRRPVGHVLRASLRGKPMTLSSRLSLPLALDLGGKATVSVRNSLASTSA